MIRFIFTITFCIFSLVSFPQAELYYRISIDDVDVTLDKIHRAGLSFEYKQSKNHLLIEVSQNELTLLDGLDIEYKIEITDLQKFYKQRNDGKDIAAILDSYKNRDDYIVPENFSFGSMGGFCTLQELYAHLDTMYLKFPNLITQRSALPGQTIQGRSIYWLRISDNPNVDEDEPEIFYNSLIHAREPASMQQLLYFMYFVLENYDTDPEIKNLIDNTEMYFVPCVNPDGYVYNQQSFPGGGGLWRKNRRTNANGSIGVDLNRNFGYNWGYDNYGSSPVPNMNTYRGEAPFSEPETQIIKSFAEDHDFKMVMNYHTYGDVLVHSWGYVSYFLPEDYEIMREIASLMTFDNQFDFGTIPRVLYLTNGDANDWFYGEQDSKPPALSYTPEVGSNDDGFWPEIENIIPNCLKCLQMNIRAARLAGFYARIKDQGSVFISNNEGYLPFAVSRTGLTDTPFSLTVVPLGNSFQSIGGAKQYETTPQCAWVYDSVFYELKPDILPGDRIEYVIKLEHEAFQLLDTITKIYGQVQLIVDYGFNDLENWVGDKWYLSENAVFSPQYSLSNVSGYYYANNMETFVFLNDTIILNETDDLCLNFKTTWDLDGGKDYVKVMYSTNYGQTWNPLKGRYTSLISDGEKSIPVYQGEEEEWVDEWFIIRDVLNLPLMIGFSFESDKATGRLGFYCDDFRLLTSQSQVIKEQTIFIAEGWSGISSFLIPEELDIEEIFGASISEIIFLTNNNLFYQPENNNSNLSNWNSGNGFLIKSQSDFTIDMSGISQNGNSINLLKGWNLIPVLSAFPVDVVSLSSDPPGLIEAIKSSCGVSVYWPGKEISSLEFLVPGKSYYVKMYENGMLKLQ